MNKEAKEQETEKQPIPVLQRFLWCSSVVRMTWDEAGELSYKLYEAGYRLPLKPDQGFASEVALAPKVGELP